ncbi:MAG: type I restriction endonuclease subunit R, partial [Erysipelotrichia bacterium]|nr:type I restriction endonuclease subunit R [Erysipelotrichia bacterium]
YYKLIKTVQSDPEFDTKRAKKKLRRYVESHEHAIRLKAEIMIDHFHEQVIGLRKIGGDARAMVVTNGIDRAIEYFHAFNNYLKERKSPYKAIVAFSGEQEYGGVKVTEATLNEFSSNDIPNRIQEDPYRFLICADKFQTGYDEPLLHTMYVDKTLSGIKAVQTLSRLNRAHPKKHDAFVLDFLNDEETIKASFSPFYRGTILSGETDPNKLHDLKAALDDAMVYSDAQIDQLVKMYLEGESREKLDPILDVCVAIYNDDLSEDEQVAFKGNAKAFNRTYSFLASILPYTNSQWEKLSIFMNFLIPKLPSPVEDDLSKGILETIDMDSYRVEKKAVIQIQLPDEDGMIESAEVGGGSGKPEPELDRLSNILKIFNDQFGNIPWSDSDRVHKLITEDIPARVAADAAYQNAIKNTPHTARIESDKALARVMVSVLKDDTELFKQFSDNPEFKRWMQDMIYGLTSSAGITRTVV